MASARSSQVPDRVPENSTAQPPALDAAPLFEEAMEGPSLSEEFDGVRAHVEGCKGP